MHPDTCKHYTGMHQDTCRLGIAYSSFGWRRWGSAQGLPCLIGDRRPKAPCVHLCLPTPEEMAAHTAEQEQAIHAIVERWREREARGECQQCGTPLTAKVQVGRCIYAEPCGCRLGQGQLRQDGRRVQRLVVTRTEEDAP